MLLNRNFKELRIPKQTTWDFVIIGGGATGLGTTIEAATRGYKTLLLEQSDFAKSTSSKSTKLVHGGVRYLAQGYVDLVREKHVKKEDYYFKTHRILPKSFFRNPNLHLVGQTIIHSWFKILRSFSWQTQLRKICSD